jgi:tryptophan-rich sensory protein
MKLVIFIVLNFGALALGSLLMGSNPGENNWYINLKTAPWTPQGWVFGAAWTIVMVTFSLFMTFSVLTKENKSSYFYSLFGIQWVLNVSWNPIFFYFHQLWLALFVMTGLIAVLLFMLKLTKNNWLTNTLIFPYLFWISVAFSLNLYVALMN